MSLPESLNKLDLSMGKNPVMRMLFQIIECLIDTVSNAMSFSPHLLLQSEESFHSCSMMTHYLHEAIFATVNQDTYTAVYRRNAHNIAIRAFKIHDVGSFTGIQIAVCFTWLEKGSTSW